MIGVTLDVRIGCPSDADGAVHSITMHKVASIKEVILMLVAVEIPIEELAEHLADIIENDYGCSANIMTMFDENSNNLFVCVNGNNLNKETGL